MTKKKFQFKILLNDCIHLELSFRLYLFSMFVWKPIGSIGQWHTPFHYFKRCVYTWKSCVITGIQRIIFLLLLTFLTSYIFNQLYFMYYIRRKSVNIWTRLTTNLSLSSSPLLYHHFMACEKPIRN